MLFCLTLWLPINSKSISSRSVKILILKGLSRIKWLLNMLLNYEHYEYKYKYMTVGFITCYIIFFFRRNGSDSCGSTFDKVLEISVFKGNTNSTMQWRISQGLRCRMNKNSIFIICLHTSLCRQKCRIPRGHITYLTLSCSNMDLSGFKRTKTKTLFYNSIRGTLSDNKEYHDVTFTRFIYTHSVHKDFHKVMVSWTKTGDHSPQKLFYVQYYFDGQEHEVDFSNYRTNFTMREKIKELNTKGKANSKKT